MFVSECIHLTAKKHGKVLRTIGELPNYSDAFTYTLKNYYVYLTLDAPIVGPLREGHCMLDLSTRDTDLDPKIFSTSL